MNKSQKIVRGGLSVVVLALLVFSLFMVGFNLWQYSKGFEENCKHCSWYEARSGNCEWSLEELDDQEHFRGDNNPSCGDMGSYEMAWKISMMLMFFIPVMFIVMLVAAVLSRNKKKKMEKKNDN